jgi:hypothetical protein
MAVDKQRLERALTLMVKRGDKFGRAGAFVNLTVDSGTGDALAALSALSAVRRPVQSIYQDLNNIETLLERLNWQRQLWQDGTLNDQRWRRFTEADIDMFHVEYRSIFDYAAVICCDLADEKVNLKDRFGWGHMLGEMKKPPKAGVRGFEEKLGQEVTELIAGADWFSLVKDVRDANVHRGGITLVFYDKPRILFQTHDAEYKNLVNVPELMYNPNVVDFEKYAGVFYGYLLTFLEDLALLVYRRTGATPRASAFAPSDELRVVGDWIRQVITPPS